MCGKRKQAMGIIPQDTVRAIEEAWICLGPIGATLKWDWDDADWAVVCDAHGAVGRYPRIDDALWCRLHHNEQQHPARGQPQGNTESCWAEPAPGTGVGVPGEAPDSPKSKHEKTEESETQYLTVEPHWNDSDFVVLVTPDGRRYTVEGADLKSAADNAMNSGR